MPRVVSDERMDADDPPDPQRGQCIGLGRFQCAGLMLLSSEFPCFYERSLIPACSVPLGWLINSDSLCSKKKTLKSEYRCLKDTACYITSLLVEFSPVYPR